MRLPSHQIIAKKGSFFNLAKEGAPRLRENKAQCNFTDPESGLCLLREARSLSRHTAPGGKSIGDKVGLELAATLINEYNMKGG
jgi:hypothetical protein